MSGPPRSVHFLAIGMLGPGQILSLCFQLRVDCAPASACSWFWLRVDCVPASPSSWFQLCVVCVPLSPGSWWLEFTSRSCWWWRPWELVFSPQSYGNLILAPPTLASGFFLSPIIIQKKFSPFGREFIFEDDFCIKFAGIYESSLVISVVEVGSAFWKGS